MPADGPAPPYLRSDRIEAGAELPPAVERRHDHVPALMAHRVTPIVTHDVTPQVAVTGSALATTASLASARSPTSPPGRRTGRPRSERWPSNQARHSDDRTCVVRACGGLVLYLGGALRSAGHRVILCNVLNLSREALEHYLARLEDRLFAANERDKFSRVCGVRSANYRSG